jgi:isoleucyl-tRNA synthetase
MLEVWARLRELRSAILGSIEPLRRDKVLGSGLEADVRVAVADQAEIEAMAKRDLSEIAIVSSVTLHELGEPGEPTSFGDRVVPNTPSDVTHIPVYATKTIHHKCGRCWRHLPEVTEDGALCSRCDQVVAGMDAGA